LSPVNCPLSVVRCQLSVVGARSVLCTTDNGPLTTDKPTTDNPVDTPTASATMRAMKDPRFTDLAKLLTHHSCEIQPGEKVLIECFDIPPEFTEELIRVIAAAGGLPIVSTYHQRVLRAIYQAASDEQMRLWRDVDKHRMEQMDAYIGVRGFPNISEMGDVPREK